MDFSARWTSDRSSAWRRTAPDAAFRVFTSSSRRGDGTSWTSVGTDMVPITASARNGMTVSWVPSMTAVGMVMRMAIPP
ncbi:hypothetical protein ACH4TM_25165 [Streptomyces parvus]|uniref:hypothetical protein n=1 Tax=Streptomyces parvus TaxID=66428 RepID=UPI003788E0A9